MGNTLGFIERTPHEYLAIRFHVGIAEHCEVRIAGSKTVGHAFGSVGVLHQIVDQLVGNHLRRRHSLAKEVRNLVVDVEIADACSVSSPAWSTRNEGRSFVIFKPSAFEKSHARTQKVGNITTDAVFSTRRRLL